MIRPVIDRVGLIVLDLEESLRFYREMFGFSIIARWNNPRQAFVGVGSAALGLIEIPTYDFGQYTQAHLAFPCEAKAFAEVVSGVRELGLDIVSGPKPQRGGEMILFRDPSGNLLEVCYPSMAKWRAAHV